MIYTVNLSASLVSCFSLYLFVHELLILLLDNKYGILFYNFPCFYLLMALFVFSGAKTSGGNCWA